MASNPHDRLDNLTEQLANEYGTEDADGIGGDSDDPEWSVEWRETDPEARPNGMAVDGEERTIYYDAWSAQ